MPIFQYFMILVFLLIYLYISTYFQFFLVKILLFFIFSFTSTKSFYPLLLWCFAYPFFYNSILFLILYWYISLYLPIFLFWYPLFFHLFHFDEIFINSYKGNIPYDKKFFSKVFFNFMLIFLHSHFDSLKTSLLNSNLPTAFLFALCSMEAAIEAAS